MVWLKKCEGICVVINKNQVVNFFLYQIERKKKGGER